MSDDGGDTAIFVIRVDKGGAVNAIVTLPSDGEPGIGLLQVNGFRVPIPGWRCRKFIGDVEQPGVSGLGGEQDQWADGDHAVEGVRVFTYR